VIYYVKRVTFYHATLCASAVFVVARRPSVCLSVTFGVLCLDDWRYRQTSFSVR